MELNEIRQDYVDSVRLPEASDKLRIHMRMAINFLLWIPARASRLHIPEDDILHSRGRENPQILNTASIVLSSLVLSTLMIKAIHSTEMSVLTRSTRRDLPEDGIRHSHRREDLKSYIHSYVLWMLTSNLQPRYVR
jgi:hypothetical protein